jgi:hypothetical protein
VEIFAKRNRKLDNENRSSLKTEVKVVDKFEIVKRIERFVFVSNRAIGLTYLVDDKLRIIFQCIRKNCLREIRTDITYTQEKHKRSN